MNYKPVKVALQTYTGFSNIPAKLLPVRTLRR